MPDQHRDQVVQLTGAELDRYANQLARCLKALDTGAPIRVHVQRELAEVHAEKDTRARTAEPGPARPPGVPILAHIAAVDAGHTARAAQQA
jgi:hypothetical protein